MVITFFSTCPSVIVQCGVFRCVGELFVKKSGIALVGNDVKFVKFNSLYGCINFMLFGAASVSKISTCVASMRFRSILFVFLVSASRMI